MKSSLLLLVLICSSLFLNACGSGGGTPPPPVATHLSVMTSSAAPVAGTPFNVTVNALDASNNVVTSYSGTVQLTTTDTQATVQPASLVLTSGTGIFQVTFRTAVSQTITATASGLTAGISGSISVSPGATAQFSVTAPMTATAGTAFTFTVTAQDASKNTTIGYTGNVHLTSSDPHPVLPADSPLTSGTGTKTFSATLNAGGAQTITATDTATPSITGTSNAITLPGITVSVAPLTASVALGTTAPFTPTVTSDAANKGVTWTVSCAVAACGSVSPTSTLNGVPTTYTAPTTPTVGNLTVTLTATSVADATKTGAATITVPGLTVSIAPPAASVQSGGTQQFIPTVNNDPSNGGVNWSLVELFLRCTTPGRNCFTVNPPTLCPTLCGTLSALNSPSGTPMTYTAPAHFTAPPNTGCGRRGCTTIFSGVFLRAISVTNSGASFEARISILPISVTVAPTAFTFTAFNGAQQFTATVTNDGTNKGVTWSLTQNGVACSPGCGTVSPANTLTGAPTTYTAPAKAPVSPTVLLTAHSVEDPLRGATATITVPVISVSIAAPTPTTVAIGSTPPPFTATVINDVSNSGVTWTLMQNGVACPAGCGTVSPVNTASGATSTYTPPAVVPAFPIVTVTATSVADATKSASVTFTVTTAGGVACGAGSGSESLLKGQYAFLLYGFDASGDVAMVGSITADGTGKITGGEEDIHRVTGLESDVVINAAGSSYAVGSDHRGCLIVANANGETTYFRFALGSVNSSSIATSGRIIEFDDTSGTKTRVTGTIRLQNATSFVAAKFKGNYAFGMVGELVGARLALAGTFASDGISALTSGNLDLDHTGQLASNASFVPGGSSFTCCTANGRGTLLVSSTSGGFSFLLYQINSGEAFLVNIGAEEQVGEAIGIPAGTVFTQASLTGASVIRETAQSSSGPIVDIAISSSNGTGALTVTDNVNSVGTFTSTTTALNYIVAANGRVTVAGGSTPPVIYLYGPNQGFLVGTDPNVDFGVIEPQTGPFNNASFTGAYTLGTENPSAPTVTLESGVVTSDGAGKAAGTSDLSSSAGLTQNQALNFTYSIPANGTGNVGSNTTAILISGNKLVFINNTSATPTITVVEK